MRILFPWKASCQYTYARSVFADSKALLDDQKFTDIWEVINDINIVTGLGESESTGWLNKFWQMKHTIKVICPHTATFNWSQSW